MVKVENFLLCLSLEMGGLVLGWISLVLYILGLIAFTIALIFLAVLNCDDLKDMMNKHFENNGEDYGEDFDKTCPNTRIIIMIVSVFAVLIQLGFIFMAYLLIKGTNNRDHLRVKPMLVVFGIVAVMSMLGVFSFTTEGVVSGVVYGSLYGYFTIVLYSLYDMFKVENENGLNNQEDQHLEKV